MTYVWPESLQPQDLVVTLLGTYVHPTGSAVWSGGLVDLLAEFGFSAGASRVALARLVRRGLLVRIRKGRHVHYEMTRRCNSLLEEGDERIFSFGRPDGAADVWTVLWHTIPEDRRLERNRLARRLRFLGFGSVQDGLWVSPRDREAGVVRLLAELEIEQYASMMVGRSARDLDIRALVERAWDLPALASRYRAFVSEFQEFGTKKAQRMLSNREAFLVRTRLDHLFRGFPSLDPDLPDALMDDPAVRRDAIAIFHRIAEGPTADRAQDYFDSVAGSAAAK